MVLLVNITSCEREGEEREFESRRSKIRGENIEEQCMRSNGIIE